MTINPAQPLDIMTRTLTGPLHELHAFLWRAELLEIVQHEPSANSLSGPEERGA